MNHIRRLEVVEDKRQFLRYRCLGVAAGPQLTAWVDTSIMNGWRPGRMGACNSNWFSLAHSFISQGKNVSYDLRDGDR